MRHQQLSENDKYLKIKNYYQVLSTKLLTISQCLCKKIIIKNYNILIKIVLYCS